MVSQAYSGPIHFRGADGVMHDIDRTLVTAGPGRFATRSTAIGVDFAARPDDPSLAVVTFDAGHSVGFGLSGAASGMAASPETLSNTAPSIVHRSILPGVNLELSTGSTGLKETLVLASPATAETFLFPLQLKGLTAVVDPSTGDVLYRDSDGTARGRTPRGFMVDSKIDPRSGDPSRSDAVTYVIVPSGVGQALKVSLDRAWLAGPCPALSGLGRPLCWSGILGR